MDGEDVKDSLIQVLKERVTSPLYGTYVITWLLWNWRAVYITLWVSEDSIKNQTKLEYLIEAASYTPSPTVVWKIDISILINIFYFFVVPAALTWLALSWLPNLQNWAYQQYLDFKEARRESLNIFNDKIEKHKQSLQNTEDYVEAIQKEKLEIQRAREELEKLRSEREKLQQTQEEVELSEEDQWDLEYEEFKSGKYFEVFNKIKNIIYGDRGDVSLEKRNSDFMDALIYFHANEIVEYRDANRDFIELTEKGAYFLKKYVNDRSLNA